MERSAGDTETDQWEIYDRMSRAEPFETGCCYVVGPGINLAGSFIWWEVFLFCLSCTDCTYLNRLSYNFLDST